MVRRHNKMFHSAFLKSFYTFHELKIFYNLNNLTTINLLLQYLIKYCILILKQQEQAMIKKLNKEFWWKLVNTNTIFQVLQYRIEAAGMEKDKQYFLVEAPLIKKYRIALDTWLLVDKNYEVFFKESKNIG